MVIGKIKNFVNKYFLGYDKSEQERYIDILERRVQNLKTKNQELKATNRKQRQLLKECEEKLQQQLLPRNLFFELHLYYAVTNKIRTTEFSFEFYISGVVSRDTDLQSLQRYFQRKDVFEQLGSEFNKNGGWDKMDLIDTTISGYDTRDVDKDVDDNFNVELEINGESKGTRRITNHTKLDE